MSRPVSDNFKRAAYAEETAAAYIILITIEHETLPEPFYFCSDIKNMSSRGQLYTAFPFDINLPSDSEDADPRTTIRIDNVDRRITAAIRSISSAPTLRIEVVEAGAPDTVEASFPDFQLTDVSYDSLTVSGSLTLEQFTGEPFPADIFSPALFPGLTS